MEKIKILWDWIKSLNLWQKIVSVIALAVLALIALMSTSACGVTRATVTNKAQNTATEVKITTSNPTTVTTTPNVNLNEKD